MGINNCTRLAFNKNQEIEMYAILTWYAAELNNYISLLSNCGIYF